MEKHIDKQSQVYDTFIDYKKAFDRVWHEGLWHVMYYFGIGNDIIQCIKSLYTYSKCSVVWTKGRNRGSGRCRSSGRFN